MAKLGNKTTTVFPAKYVAAMKATENIDDIRHRLKTFNIQLSTKNKVWDVTKGWTGKGLHACNLNKVVNSVIFSIFEAKDSRQNLRICLERFEAHIDKLMDLTWINRTFRIFMFGDCKFLSSMYGISGAAGLHPCIWCKISSEMMQFLLFIRMLKMPVKCTLASLWLRHEEFVAKCRGNLKNAKTISNVIDPVFFNIELTQVCLPGLHTLMGVFLKIFTDVNGGTKIDLH